MTIPRCFNGPLESGNGGYCPTVFASFLDSEAEEHVVVGWPPARDGRKLRAGSAVFGAGGEVLAVTEGLVVEPRA